MFCHFINGLMERGVVRVKHACQPRALTCTRSVKAATHSARLHLYPPMSCTLIFTQHLGQDNRSSLESCAQCNTLDSNLSFSTWIFSWSKSHFKLNRRKWSSTLFSCCSRSLVTTRSSTSSSRSFHGPLWGFSLIRASEITPFCARFEWRSHGQKICSLQLTV